MIPVKMNVSNSQTPIHLKIIDNLPPGIGKASHEFIRATAFLLIPVELLYFSLYFHTKGLYKPYKLLSFLSILAFWISPVIAPITCPPVRCLQNFASELGQSKYLSPIF
jgi:hypothetical protein